MAPPESMSDKNGEDGAENSKENMDPLMMDLQVQMNKIMVACKDQFVTNYILAGFSVRASSNSIVHDRSLQLRCGQHGAAEAVQHGAGQMLQRHSPRQPHPRQYQTVNIPSDSQSRDSVLSSRYADQNFIIRTHQYFM